jgi:proteasome lid subunit RPN8/RPN11
MIEIPREVYEKFLQFALENANPLGSSQKWRECIGLILGRISDDNIDVTEIVPISSGSAVFVDITDYEQVFSLISFERIDEGEVIVGWAHTHPGLGLFFSGTDIETQLTYQKMHPQSFGLVLDPTKVKTDFSGFNIYRVDINTARPYTVDYEFTEHFNFQSVHEHLTYDLYGAPIETSDTGPFLLENNEVVWKNIIISIKEPNLIESDKTFNVKIEINLPFRQFVRVEYELSAKINNLPVHIESGLQKFYFHETISSGTLSLHSFRLEEKKELIIFMKGIKIVDYTQKYFDLPNLILKLKPI